MGKHVMARIRKVNAKPTKPLSIRLTEEERAILEKAAAGVGMSAFIRARLFDGRSHQRRRGKMPVKDHETLGQALGRLGASGVARDLNELGAAARSGSLPLTPETEEVLRQACADIRAVREMIMAALGVGARKP